MSVSSSTSDSEIPSSSEDTGSDSGNASTSEIQRDSSDNDHGRETSGQNPDDAFSAVFALMKGNPILWQQFTLMAAQFGMSTELFEKYLGLVVKSVCTNPDVKAQISAQAGAAAQSNPIVLDQLLAMAALQQAMNPILIAQFVAQNGAQAKEGESSDESSSLAPVPAWRRYLICGKERLEEIWKREVPWTGLSEHDWDSDDLIHLLFAQQKNNRYFDRCGELNLSNEEVWNIGCETKHFPEKVEFPDLDEMLSQRKIYLYRPKVLGLFSRSLSKFCQAHGTSVDRVVLAQPSDEDEPVRARIRLHEIRDKVTDKVKAQGELFLQGRDTYIKGKKGGPVFVTGLARRRRVIASKAKCDAFIHVLSVKFLSPPFPTDRWLRSDRRFIEREFGPAQFIDCTFDAPLVIQSDVWLLSCKGKELQILDNLAARCIKCKFDHVKVFAGYIIAKDCHFGKLSLAELSPNGNPLETKSYTDRRSHFCLDNCVIDEAENFADPHPDMPKFAGVSECSKDSLKTRMKLEDMWRKRKWVRPSQPERYMLRTIKICHDCSHSKCFRCGCSIVEDFQETKPMSICQFCLAEESEPWACLNRCATCYDRKKQLVAHARLCKQCGEGYNPHGCIHCGAHHGWKVVFDNKKKE